MVLYLEYKAQIMEKNHLKEGPEISLSIMVTLRRSISYENFHESNLFLFTTIVNNIIPSRMQSDTGRGSRIS